MKKSLLAPAIDASEEYGAYAVVPSLIGFLIGAAFVYVSDLFLPHDTVEILKPKTTKKEKIETEVISNATNKTVRNRKPKGKLLKKRFWNRFLLKPDASSRWPFHPKSAWGSIGTMTIGKTHPSLF